jgi:hypothetical protein
MAATDDAARGLPRVAEGAILVPQEDLAGAPNVVVDGPLLPGTVLSLSHWRGSATPEALRDDTSALIVLRYLAADADGPEVHAVTNNHYDEDGLFAIWLLLERPPVGSPARALAVAAAEAGDFGTWTDPWAPRVAIASMAMAERGVTPFPEVGRILATAGAVDPAGRLYRAIACRVPAGRPRPLPDALATALGAYRGRRRVARHRRRDDRGRPGRRSRRRPRAAAPRPHGAPSAHAAHAYPHGAPRRDRDRDLPI